MRVGRKLEVSLFAPEDLLLIKPQAAQLRDIARDKRLEYGHQFAATGSAFTLWLHEPVPVPLFCGGHVRQHTGYASLWGIFAERHREARLFIARTIRRYVADLSHERIDAQVASSNEAACGWARLIGLVEETRLRAAMPDGSDMIYFVKPSVEGVS